ncbi:2-hydroxyacid dehydrogenase [Lampropedia aestuarii]|uniref:2-hydroxyacid dehydrogenase n=1 Tax=Lampropedia aestuarii TaxID=2562762 RepID=UPI002468CCF2|nr:2-hydroxyacid dehydrogenase [Lampropedia aestuarii]MDH5858702.1 2-hydroxyacid dehydrogenase [Lampropedia aestuarii]
MTTSLPIALVVAPLSMQALQPLSPFYRLLKWSELGDQQAFLRTHGQAVRVVITNGIAGLPAGCAEQLHQMQLIACNGVGYDAIDMQWAAQHSVAVTNTPDVLSADVADLAMALLLAVFRQIPQADRFVRDGQWLKGPMPLGRRVAGTRIGIVGLGKIGALIAKRCEAFDTQVAYTGRHAQSAVNYPFFDSALSLAQSSDVLIVATPGGDATRHLVNAAVLEALGPQGVLVNISRGSVVDQAALIDALEQGRIAAAGLDVFNQEPHVPEALTRMRQVVLSPHIASATHQTRQAMLDLLIDNVLAFTKGAPLPSQVVEQSA